MKISVPTTMKRVGKKKLGEDVIHKNPEVTELDS